MPVNVETGEVLALLEEGAQLVDVLPTETFVREHLPGAVNVPLGEIDSAEERLDRGRPVVVYCYDYQCDLSARAARRLEQLGFAPVYDYVPSKIAWLADGLPSAGLVDDSHRAVACVHRDVPTVGVDATLDDVKAAMGDWEIAAVVDDDDVVLGVVRAEAADLRGSLRAASIMQPAPATVRPSIPQEELARNMENDGHDHLLVTTLSGKLIGLVRRRELRAAAA